MSAWCGPATARLAKDGWLEGRRAGKLSEYHLSPDGRERFAEATKRIYSAPDTEWSGRWTLAVLPPMGAAERKELREETDLARVWRALGQCICPPRGRFSFLEEAAWGGSALQSHRVRRQSRG